MDSNTIKFGVDYEILYTPETNNFNVVNPVLVFYKRSDIDEYFIAFDTFEKMGVPMKSLEGIYNLPLMIMCGEKRIAKLMYERCVGGYRLKPNYRPCGWDKPSVKARKRIEKCDEYCDKEWKVFAFGKELDTVIKNPLVGKHTLTCYGSGDGKYYVTKGKNRTETAELTLVNGQFLSMDYKQPMSGGKRIKDVIIL